MTASAGWPRGYSGRDVDRLPGDIKRGEPPGHLTRTPKGPVTKALNIVGLVLALIGALLLSWRDLTGWTPPPPRWKDLDKPAVSTSHKIDARVAFPLIAVGVVLQIIAVLN